MNPESITVSLKTAKKLKKAGFNKKTVFVWDVYDNYFTCLDSESIDGLGHSYKRSKRLLLAGDVNRIHKKEWLDKFVEIYPAPTSGEIDLPFPYTIVFVDNEFRISVDYDKNEFGPMGRVECGKTEVKAKAKMWLYLKGKGLI